MSDQTNTRDSYDFEEQKILLEQWEKMNDLADNNSERRIKTNSIYITINTIITAGTSRISGIPSNILALIGMLISLLWIFSVLNYRLTNKYRYKVIRNLEKQMRYRPITEEYQLLKNLKFYLGNSIIEIIIPAVFIIAFLTILIC